MTVKKETENSVQVIRSSSRAPRWSTADLQSGDRVQAVVVQISAPLLLLPARLCLRRRTCLRHGRGRRRRDLGQHRWGQQQHQHQREQVQQLQQVEHQQRQLEPRRRASQGRGIYRDSGTAQKYSGARADAVARQFRGRAEQTARRCRAWTAASRQADRSAASQQAAAGR